MNETLENTGGCLMMIVVLGYGLLQLYAGYLGIDLHFGSGWAIGAVVVALLLRFTLPITIGSFFGAMDVWGWHWVGAVLFAAPGLAFVALMIPGALQSLFRKQ